VTKLHANDSDVIRWSVPQRHREELSDEAIHFLFCVAAAMDLFNAAL